MLSLKQLLFPSDEDSGAGPPLQGDGVPEGGPLSPTQTQEIRVELLSLEETVKQLEVVARGWGGKEVGEEGVTQSRDTSHGNPHTHQEVEEEFCRLRLILSQLGENTVPQPGCT